MNFYNYSKFNAEKTTIDGHEFPSKKEAKRYSELKLLQQQGYIKNLKLQPKFELLEGFTYRGKRFQPMTYTPDFMYEENGERVVEEVKGVKTKDYLLRKKLFLHKYGDLYKFCEI